MITIHWALIVYVLFTIICIALAATREKSYGYGPDIGGCAVPLVWLIVSIIWGGIFLW